MVSLEIRACGKYIKDQWIDLLSDLPLKLVTPLSIIVMTSALSHTGYRKLFGLRGRCLLGKTGYCLHGVHCQSIISNAVLQLSLSQFTMLNELQSGRPNQCFNDLLYYSDARIEVQLTFGNVFTFCFR